MINVATARAAENLPGLKFGMPAPLPKTENFKNRYDPVVDQFTKLLMQDGKLSRAQKVSNLPPDSYLQARDYRKFNFKKKLCIGHGFHP